MKKLLAVLLFVASTIFIVWFHNVWIVYPYVYYLNESWIKEDVFRAFNVEWIALESLEEKAETFGCAKSDLMAVLMVENGYHLTNLSVKVVTQSDYESKREKMIQQNQKAFESIRDTYAALLEDLRYFPVLKYKNINAKMPVFEDSWQEERLYGGTRRHEGCDLMGDEYESGFYPIVSVSDGVVEKVGWLEKGGWRIGIRAPHGAYFYYAHLSEYADGMVEGRKIRAGEILGYMGDTGYGIKEGTRGNFPVHLHFGIYLKTRYDQEMSVNPYSILRYLEKDFFLSSKLHRGKFFCTF